jgi:hypothetical protein
MRQRIIDASDVTQFQLPVWDVPVVPNSTQPGSENLLPVSSS